MGSGRIATALQEMGPGNDVSAWTHACCHCAEPSAHASYAFLQTVIKRGEKISTTEGPIVVCTRNDDLQAVLDATPQNRHEGVATAAPLPSRQRSCCWLSMSHIICTEHARYPPGACSNPVTATCHACRSGVHPEWHAAAVAGCKGPGQEHTGDFGGLAPHPGLPPKPCSPILSRPERQG